VIVEHGQRVAVVGAGIAGCAAAWSLQRAGFEVELFEAAGTIGGNAKTHDWLIEEGRRVTVGLSVLAWPAQLFRNYRALLATLGIEVEPVTLRFFIRSGDEVWTHGGEGGLARRYARDARRWQRLIAFVRRVNHVCNGFARTASLYHVAPLNPMNVIPLWPLARAFGISRGFWDDIVVAFYSATFLSTKLERTPAVILPTISDILPIDRAGELETWRESSRAVFERMVAGLQVHTRRAIVRIEPSAEGVALADQHGVVHGRFAKVVLACSAAAIDQALVGRRRLHELLLRKLSYVDAVDSTFLEGVVHGDPTVITPEDRNAVLAEHCNYVRVQRAVDGSPRYENHFVLSSWLPAARGSRAPMLVSYNSEAAPDPLHRHAVVDNREAHPELSVGNLARALLWRLLQGKDGLYYCGSLATPGNGHDLSLLSGLVVAEQIGAPYPFAADREACADFERLRRLMLGRLANRTAARARAGRRP
jgi:predicted NAD/FAD-binding protein